MSAVWTINGLSFDALGITSGSGSFRQQMASTMTFERGCDFDADESLTYGATVVVERNGAPFFQGKVTGVPKFGSGEQEGHEYLIVDAWEDFTKTTYQELWGLGESAYYFPRFVFGVGPGFDGNIARISVGQIIRNAVSYAATVGVNIAVGSIPGGEVPVPHELSNVSVAEVITDALKLHPDWIPWINHTTTPPTFNVTPVSALTARTVLVNGVDDVSNFSVIRRDDLIPEAVRIIYEFATTVEDEVFRNAVIDKFPADGPNGGPAVIQAYIPLQGMQMQVQKSQVQTRTLPESDNLADAKEWMLKAYPQLSEVDEDHFDITEWKKILVLDDETHAPPINPNAERMTAEALGHVPRELVRGNVAEWMRRRVGPVKLDWEIEISSSATEEEKKILNKLPSGATVTGTNAVTKIYHGLSQWVAPEDVPEGLAQAVFQSITAAYPYEGNVTLTEEDVGGVRWMGSKVSLVGGEPEWATMGAAVHSVDFDIQSGRTTVSFGAPPYLAPADFLELQRILRWRPTRWWSVEERDSNRLGHDTKASSQGDTVTPYDIPMFRSDSSLSTGEAETSCPFGSLRKDGDDTYIRGGHFQAGDKNFLVPDQLVNTEVEGVFLVQVILDGIKCATDDAEQIFLPGGVTTSTGTPEWDTKEWTEGTDYDDNENPTDPTASGTVVAPVGKMTIDDGGNVSVAWEGCGGFVVTQCAGILSLEPR